MEDTSEPMYTKQHNKVCTIQVQSRQHIYLIKRTTVSVTFYGASTQWGYFAPENLNVGSRYA